MSKLKTTDDSELNFGRTYASNPNNDNDNTNNSNNDNDNEEEEEDDDEGVRDDENDE